MEFPAVALPVALGIIMFGLGLDLTPADFARVAKQPKAAAVALACQLLLLPAICFASISFISASTRSSLTPGM